jgi:iron complex transport system substrate-binding protein
MLPRRALLAAALAAPAGLAACGRQAATAPDGGVLAAGQPAALLIFALAPERLIGWPLRPGPEAMTLLPPAADLPQVGALASGGPPIGLEAAAALRPAMALDYGDVDADYRALARRARAELDLPYHLIDGRLAQMPAAFREAGRLLGVEPVGEGRAADAERLLAALPAGGGPSFYLARSGDGLETAFPGALAVEALEAAGWTNVATGGTQLGRVTPEQVAAWDPEVIVTQDADFAAVAATTPFWARRRSGAARRIVGLAARPFGWIDRPPSVNRMIGLAWLASRDPLGPPDPTLAQTVAQLHERLYHRRPTPEQVLDLLPRIVA